MKNNKCDSEKNICIDCKYCPVVSKKVVFVVIMVIAFILLFLLIKKIRGKNKSRLKPLDSSRIRNIMSGATPLKKMGDEKPSKDFPLFGATITINSINIEENKEKPIVSYRVRIETKGKLKFKKEKEIWRRYSQFATLHQGLQEDKPDPCTMFFKTGKCSTGLPPFPRKTVRSHTDPEFLEKRQEALVAYLEKIVEQENLANSPVFREFCECEKE